MSALAPAQTVLHRHAPPWPSTRAALILWLFAGVSLACFLGNPPVQRTQEARVLETARQMRGTGWQGWLIPKINGNLRLQKPPLAYWATATAYNLTGRVSNAVGRAPTVLFGWLTLAVTFAAADWLFGRRTALLAAGCLLCSYLFFRHDRLAETDAPSALFVTIAVYAWWRGVEGSGEGARGREGERGNGRSSRIQQDYVIESNVADSLGHPASIRNRTLGPLTWFNIGAVATALAILFKGGPGAFPPLFLLGLICLRRRWGAAWSFIRSGAPFIIALLALPWFIYAKHSASAHQFRGEVDDLFSGNDHFAPAWHYVHLTARAVMPWLLLVPSAIGMALWPLVEAFQARRRQRDASGRTDVDAVPLHRGIVQNEAARFASPDSRAVATWQAWADAAPAGLLVWALACLLPLCVIGNKQFHYLLPAMPPLMILTGWLLNVGTTPGALHGRAAILVGAVVDSTLLLMPLLAAPLVLLAGYRLSGAVRPLDWMLAGGITIALTAVGVAYTRRGRLSAVITYLFACAMLMPVVAGLYVPTVEENDAAAVAVRVRDHFGDGPYVFYGPNYSLPLCFNLRAVIPSARTAEELATRTAQRPNLVVISQTKGRYRPPAVPPGFVLQMKLTEPQQAFEFYRLVSPVPGDGSHEK